MVKQNALKVLWVIKKITYASFDKQNKVTCCTSCAILIDLCQTSYVGEENSREVDRGLWILTQLNFVANPLIYCSCQRRYRNAVLSLPGFRFVLGFPKNNRTFSFCDTWDATVFMYFNVQSIYPHAQSLSNLHTIDISSCTVVIQSAYGIDRCFIYMRNSKLIIDLASPPRKSKIVNLLIELILRLL